VLAAKVIAALVCKWGFSVPLVLTLLCWCIIGAVVVKLVDGEYGFGCCDVGGAGADPDVHGRQSPEPPLPLVVEELVLRRSARYLNRLTRPNYADQEPPKKPGSRGKRKRDEEKPELAAQQGTKTPGRNDSNVEASERKPMPVTAAVPACCVGVAAEDDATPTRKSAKLRVKETLRAFNSHYLHFVQVPLCVWMLRNYPL
jgi:hypothetical protein